MEFKRLVSEDRLIAAVEKRGRSLSLKHQNKFRWY